MQIQPSGSHPYVMRKQPETTSPPPHEWHRSYWRGPHAGAEWPGIVQPAVFATSASIATTSGYSRRSYRGHCRTSRAGRTGISPSCSRNGARSAPTHPRPNTFLSHRNDLSSYCGTMMSLPYFRILLALSRIKGSGRKPVDSICTADILRTIQAIIRKNRHRDSKKSGWTSITSSDGTGVPFRKVPMVTA